MDDSNGANGVKSLQFDFATIMAATDNFSIKNKLGQGGFGAVYKSRLQDGQDIAAKRLSKNSGQGELEFMNELLIFEFVPNSSLDHFLFDLVKGLQLDWVTRYKIIGGIAKGILYIHEDSRHRIIYHGLKISNNLLDVEMNPKISDFGMTRLFLRDETHADTHNTVGTFEYMTPEYVMNGKFLVKSNVYSFGGLILEIISSQKIDLNNGEEGESLLTYAWRNWMEGTTLNFVDSNLRDGSRSEMMRCIQLGFLVFKKMLLEDQPWPLLFSGIVAILYLLKCLQNQHMFHSLVEPEASTRAPIQFTVNFLRVTCLLGTLFTNYRNNVEPMETASILSVTSKNH
ncbi:hypothetical protein SLE2022_015160 [Rubroshorea leprosula]